MDCSNLPPRERAACYRQFAEKMEEFAERATTAQIRDAYLSLARGWQDLAGKLSSETRQLVTIPLHDPELAPFLRDF